MARGHHLDAAAPDTWQAAPEVLLAQDTALELGGPRATSAFALLWDDAGEATPGRVTLVGPDLEALPRDAAPLAVVVLASGPPLADDALYAHLCALRDAVYGVHLRGVQARLLPSQQSVWLRVSHRALGGGFQLGLLGGALIRAVAAVSGVDAVEVLLATDAAAVDALLQPAQEAASVFEALGAMEEGKEMDCDGCQYQAMCDLVDELRRAHAQKVAP